MIKKKATSVFSKLLYFVNSIFATVLLLSYALPYISPKAIPIFAVLSLFVPFLIIINTFFLVYWIIKFRKYFLLSAAVLSFGLFISSPFYKIAGKKNYLEGDLKIMTYNVHTFNYYKHIDKDSIDQKIIAFIHNKKPDILAIQEYHHSDKRKLNFTHQYFVPKPKHKKFGLAIFSNYKIINTGSLDFKNSNNNAIFVDLIKDKDTIRVYNVHLQSLKINPNKENFGQENSEKLIERLEYGFLQQASQTEQLLLHERKWKGKKIICGDFNNTAYSWVYKQLKNDKKDAFTEAGKGFGRSFNYFFPMRIDFILVDKKSTINYFENYTKKYSDHYPIMARINWK